MVKVIDIILKGEKWKNESIGYWMDKGLRYGFLLRGGKVRVVVGIRVRGEGWEVRWGRRVIIYEEGYFLFRIMVSFFKYYNKNGLID